MTADLDAKHFHDEDAARQFLEEVRWPDGTVTHSAHVPVDRIVTLYQSATDPSSQRHSGRKSGT